VQATAGFMCVALGALHFLDREHHPTATRSYYVGSWIPRSSATRAGLALVEVCVGFVLLFTA
jgi:hypothetical protein